MERTRFIEHKGKRILLFDYTGIRETAVALREIEHSKAVVRQHPPKSLLILTNVRDARYNTDILQAMKELAKHDEPYVKASCVVGLSGLLRIAYQAISTFSGRKIQICNSEDEAKDWLVSQA